MNKTQKRKGFHSAGDKTLVMVFFASYDKLENGDLVLLTHQINFKLLYNDGL